MAALSSSSSQAEVSSSDTQGVARKRRTSSTTLLSLAEQQPSRRRGRAAPQPLLAAKDVDVLPAVGNPQSLAYIALAVHNTVDPSRAPLGVAEAFATWTDRLNRFLQLERSQRSMTVLDVFRKAIFALAGDRLTGRAVCESKYETGQADVWQLIMDPRGTGGAGNCIAYTNAVALIADHFGLFGPLVRIGGTSTHAFLLARDNTGEQWRVVDATGLEAYAAHYVDNVALAPPQLYGLGEYTVISNANEFRLDLLNQVAGWLRRQTLEAEKKVVMDTLAAPQAGAADYLSLLARQAATRQRLSASADAVRAAVADAQQYPVRTLPVDDPHFGKYWDDRVIALQQGLLPVQETGGVANRRIPGLNVTYLTSLRRTFVGLIANHLVGGSTGALTSLGKQLLEYVQIELQQEDARAYELDQAVRLMDWLFYSLQQYLVPPHQLVLEWRPAAAGYVGAGTREESLAAHAQVKYHATLWAQVFRPLQADVWTPLRQLVQAVVQVGWWEEPGPPLLQYRASRTSSSSSGNRIRRR